LRPEIGERHVLAEADAAKKRKPGLAATFVEGIGDELIFWWSGATPDAQPRAVGSRSSIYDLDGHAWIAKQVVGDVRTRSFGADDRDAQRPRRCPVSSSMPRAGSRRRGLRLQRVDLALVVIALCAFTTSPIRHHADQPPLSTDSAKWRNAPLGHRVGHREQIIVGWA